MSPVHTSSAIEAAEFIRAGRLAVFPTDTVIGLGGDPFQGGVLERMARIKGRAPTNPFALLASTRAMAEAVLDKPLPPAAAHLADRYWPGPLTMVLPFEPGTSRSVGGALADRLDRVDWAAARPWLFPKDQIGLRVPAGKWLHQLLKASGGLLAATSANFAGGREPVVMSMLQPNLLALVDVIYDHADGGHSSRSKGAPLPSTVLSFAGGGVHVLRAGAITIGELKPVG